MECQNCKAQLNDDAKFCEKCGSAVAPQGKFCQNCGVSVGENDAVCANCNAQLTPIPDAAPRTPAAEPPAPTAEPPTPAAVPPAPVAASPASVAAPPAPVAAPPAPVKKKKTLIVAIAIVLAAAILVVAAITLVPTFLGGSVSNQSALLYLKDNEIHQTALSPISPIEITDRLFDDKKISSSETFALSYFVAYNQDKNIIFYPDRVSNYDTGVTLYYKDLKSDKDAIKIDSDIQMFRVNQSGTNIFYVKGSERNLYAHDLSDKEKISGEVTDFYINESGSKVIYVTGDGDIYVRDNAGEKEKIDSSSSIVYVSDDLSRIYYLKDASLFVKKGIEDKEKIASDVSSVIKVYDSGEVYYLKSEDNEIRLMDYVYDDLAESDATLVEPEEPVSPSWYDFDTWDDYYAAQDSYDLAYTAYLEEYSAYLSKYERDYLRDALNEEKMTMTNRTLYFYDNSESTAISDLFYYTQSIHDKKPVIVYYKYNKADLNKLNLSELDSYYDVYSMIDAGMYSSTDAYISVQSNETAIEQSSGTSYSINYSGTAIYFLDDYSDENQYGDLYQMTINGTSVESPSKYDDDVYNYSFLNDSDTFTYFKDVKNSVGDLYMNKERIDFDVYTYSVTGIDGSEALAYLVDYNENKRYGTLKLFNGTESLKISDDVNERFIAINKNSIAYLLDFNLERDKGDAYLFDGSEEKKKIDEDIVSFISIIDWGYKVPYGQWFDYGYYNSYSQYYPEPTYAEPATTMEFD